MGDTTEIIDDDVAFQKPLASSRSDHRDLKASFILPSTQVPQPQIFLNDDDNGSISSIDSEELTQPKFKQTGYLEKIKIQQTLTNTSDTELREEEEKVLWPGKNSPQKRVPDFLVSEISYASEQQSQVTYTQSDFDCIFESTEEFIFVMGGYGQHGFTRSVEVHDVKRGIWRTFKGKSPRLTNFGAIMSAERTIYTLGGKNKNQMSVRKIQNFNLDKMNLVRPFTEHLPFDVSGCAVTTIRPQREFYLCGGNIDGKTSRRATKMTIRGQKISFEDLPDMLEAREEHGLVTGPDQRVYAVGGCKQDGSYLDSIEVFDSNSQTWSIKTTIPCGGIKAMGTVSLPDGIYLMGGYLVDKKQYTSQCWRYDITLDRWTQIESMQLKRGAFSTNVLSNFSSIFVIGGFEQDGHPTNKVERYDVANRKWQAVAPLARARFMHSSCLATVKNSK